MMIDWVCKSCKEETEHKIKDSDHKSFKDHKILTCQECNNKEMVPERVLKNKGEDIGFKLSESVGPDGGFDREVDPDCESGICGAR